MARNEAIKFEVVGLSRWAWGDGDDSHVFEAGEHEVSRPSKALQVAIQDAADAGVGVNLLDGKKD